MSCEGNATEKSAGYDNISMETIKLVITYIDAPLNEIINKSFTTGSVPDQLKIATVCPTCIFKKWGYVPI